MSYTGAVGGKYSAQTIGPTIGHTITLFSGNLTDCNGGILSAGKF